jgi:hypothetical protein
MNRYLFAVLLSFATILATIWWIHTGQAETPEGYIMIGLFLYIGALGLFKHFKGKKNDD